MVDVIAIVSEIVISAVLSARAKIIRLSSLGFRFHREPDALTICNGADKEASSVVPFNNKAS